MFSEFFSDPIGTLIQLKAYLNPDILAAALVEWGWLAYPILFGIIFAETGLLIGFFFPGDSLLFIAGFVASTPALDILKLNLLLIAAAIIGDTVGYLLGRKAKPVIRFRPDSIFFKQRYLKQTEEFYEKHGGKTIILARFIPIVRTFAPFVAGLADMDYKKFVSFNVIGGIAWITSMSLAGYYLGSVPIIKDNFEKAVLLIIFISLLPPIIETLRHRRAAKSIRQE